MNERLSIRVPVKTRRVQSSVNGGYLVTTFAESAVAFGLQCFPALAYEVEAEGAQLELHDLYQRLKAAVLNLDTSMSETESCTNCGRAIGRLETGYLRGDNVVCHECYERLVGASTSHHSQKVEQTYQSQFSKWTEYSVTNWVIAGVIGLGLIWLLLVKWNNDGNSSENNEVTISEIVCHACVSDGHLAPSWSS